MIKKVIERNKKEITQSKATRLIKVAYKESDAIITAQEEVIDSLEEQFEDKLNSLAARDKTIDSASVREAVRELHQLNHNLILAQIQLKVDKEFNKAIKDEE